MMNHKEYMKSLCHQYMHQPVTLHTADNQQIQGIIENVDDEYVHMLVPMNMPMAQTMMPGQGQMMGSTMNRQWFGFPGFWGPPFGRFFFPLAALSAISLLPFI